MRKLDFAYVKTKAQISFAVTAKLISVFVFATRIVQSLFFLNPKIQASACFCDCTGRFVGTPKTVFLMSPLIWYMPYTCIVLSPGEIDGERKKHKDTQDSLDETKSK